MAQKYEFYYGLDPEKPYTISYYTQLDLDIQENNYSAANVLTFITEGLRAGNIAPDSEMFVKAFAYIAQAGFCYDAVTWYYCNVYQTDTGASNSDPDAMALRQTIADIDYQFGTAESVAPYRDYPSATAGFYGRTQGAGNGTRPYRIGLLREKTGRIADRTRQFATAIVANDDIFHMYLMLIQHIPLAVTGYNDAQKRLVNVNIQPNLRKTQFKA